jgi:hypothetical protein
VDGDGKILAGAGEDGRRETTTASASAATAISAAARREPFTARLQPGPGVGSSRFYTPGSQWRFADRARLTAS